jgi:hypothetical protein
MDRDGFRPFASDRDGFGSMHLAPVAVAAPDDNEYMMAVEGCWMKCNAGRPANKPGRGRRQRSFATRWSH